MNERVYHVLEDLLNIDREPARNELRPTAVQDLLLEAMEGLELVFLDRGIALRVHLPEEVPPVLADPTRLQLVFQNLLTNALRYTGEGGKVVRPWPGISAGRNYIHHLRHKLEDDPARPVYLSTEPGVGYRLKYQE